MDESRLADAVDAPVAVLGEVPNTTDRARRLGREGAAHGAFVVAESLTAARGRDGSDWSAPPGGVWSSTLLRPDLPLPAAGRLTLAGGLAARDAAAAFGVDAALKWPNDVVVMADDGERRKLAGVLTELVVDEVPVAGKPVADAVPGAEREDLQFAVMGIGVNADVDPDALATDRAATSLRAATGAVDPTAVAVDLHANLLERAAQAEADFDGLLADVRGHLATLGERVRVERRDGTTVAGVATDLTDAGELVVEGEERHVVAEGEVARLRRPDG
jgi:BirA family biotin operon repressor/biotin-[acetyl-CoA-carboxylase] ligase